MAAIVYRRIKKLPLTTTVTVVPRLPDAGETDVIAGPAGAGGAGAVMVTVCTAVELTPPLPSLTVTTMTRASVRLPREIRNGSFRAQISSFASTDKNLVGTERKGCNEVPKSKSNG